MRLESGWSSLRVVLGLVVCAMLTAPISAQHLSLDDLAERLASQITKADVKSVAVVDFLGTNGQKSDLGWYLASKLSDDLLGKAKNFRILDRAELTDTRINAEDAASAESLKRIGGTWGVETIVTGVVEISADQYLVTVTLRKTADGAVIATASQVLQHSRVLDLLSPAGAEVGAADPLRAGVMGVGVPACTYCPVPGYSDQARKARIQSATVVLMVTISAKGSAEKISVLKSPGYGLAEKAIETVSDWKFRPAPGKDGAPVPVAVPIEVSFRSSRT
jgi:TonB family protein